MTGFAGNTDRELAASLVDEMFHGLGRFGEHRGAPSWKRFETSKDELQ